MEGYALQVRELTDGIRNLAREIVVGDEYFNDTVGDFVTLDTVPGATVIFRSPGSQYVGVIQGLLKLQEGLLVIRMARLLRE